MDFGAFDEEAAFEAGSGADEGRLENVEAAVAFGMTGVHYRRPNDPARRWASCRTPESAVTTGRRGTAAAHREADAQFGGSTA